MSKKLDGELGRTGQYRFGGLFYDEFLTNLQGLRGVRIYQEMSENDDVVGAVLFGIKMLIRQADWLVQPGGDTEADKEATAFVNSCMHDMQSSWTDTISEILSFLTYSWSAHEIVYKRRMGRNKNPILNSKHNDGLIGWRKLPIRGQDTLYQWEYDSNDELIGLTQNPAPSYRLITIPIDKLLLFRTESRKDSPDIETQDITALGNYIKEMTGIGVITPDEALEDYVRRQASLPERV